MKQLRKYINKYFFKFLTLGSVIFLIYQGQVNHAEQMEVIEPLRQQIDSICEHVNFVDSSHFDWCGFEPNGKYTAYK